MQQETISGSDRWIPWAIAVFFALFVTLLSGFAWIAIHSYTGEVTENAYKKGLAYNADIAHAKAQAELGWEGTLDLKTRGKTVDIVFTLRDRYHRVIGDAVVTATLSRPTQAGHDQTLALAYRDGAYRGTATLEWEGVWDVRISATSNSNNYQQSKTAVLQ